MSILTNILYWLSTGMLIPVIVLLLLAFVWSLILIGEFYGLYVSRCRIACKTKDLLQDVKTRSVKTLVPESCKEAKGKLFEHLMLLNEVNWHPVHGEKIVSDFELASRQDIEGPTTLMRVGPMLGLMGTLIPMGPALVGLAAGDIASMAANMQVAFSTTVLGIFIGAIGFVIQLIKQRWAHADREILIYLFDLSQEKERHETPTDA